MIFQIINICNIFDISVLYQLFDIYRPESFDIHRVPADKVNQMPLQLRRAIFIDAPDIRRIVIPDRLFPADRAYVWNLKGHPAVLPLFLFYFLDLGYNFAGFIDDDRISDSDLKFVHKILIVKRRPGNRWAAETNRFKHRRRRNASGTPYRQFNFL